MKTRFCIFFVTAIVITAVNIYGLDVNTRELKDAKKVEFTNYIGPVGSPDSIEDVLSVGRQLAVRQKQVGDNRTARFFDKYSVIRAISKTDNDKLNADIFIIEKNAKVSHIRFVRRMIAGYLQGRYGYSSNDAETLALFVTYYNAVYRGNMGFFNERYKPGVMKYISANNAGIDTIYTNWPGKTRMLIPLTDDPADSSITSIDPTSLTGKDVRDMVRKDDSTMPERKRIIDLQEQTIAKEKTAVEREKKALEDEKRRLDREKKAIEEKKKEQETRKQQIAKKEEEVQKQKQETKKITDPEKRKESEKEIKEKEEKIAGEKETAKEEDKKIEESEKKTSEKEKDIAKKEDDVTKKEEKVAEKEESVKEQKEEIARDQRSESEAKTVVEEKEKELAKKEEDLKKREEEIRKADSDRAILGEKLYYLRIQEWIKNGHYNNELFMINAATFKVMKKSPVENIGGRNYIVYSNGIVVITHPGGYGGTYHLTLVNTETLELITRGTDNIFWRSFLELNEGYLYAVFIDDKKNYLGKFNDKMELVGRSKNEVLSDTFISFFQDKIYINSKDKRIMVLKKEDLSLIDFIQP